MAERPQKTALGSKQFGTGNGRNSAVSAGFMRKTEPNDINNLAIVGKTDSTPSTAGRVR